MCFYRGVSRVGKAELISAIGELEQEQRRIAGRISALRELAAQLPGGAAETPAVGVVCPHDGLQFASEARLEEHLANVHA